MKNIRIFSLLFLITLVIFGCDKKQDSLVQLSDEFTAGPDTIVYDTIAFKLNATSVDSLDITGTWRIIQGDELTSGFSDKHDSKAVFHGIYRDEYILEWSATAGDIKLSDMVSVRFVASLPPDLTAGGFYVVYDTNYVILNGSPLKEGLLGTWSAISENFGDIEFSDKNAANSICTGKPLNSYSIRWSVSNGLEEKYADTRFIIGDRFVDQRDNKNYKKVKIGNQVWMAEDLKADKYPDGASLTLLPDNTSLYDGNLYDESYFKKSEYQDLTGTTFPIDDEGYYYTWAAVMNNSLSTDNSPSGVQGICPDGWHVPSSAECYELYDFLTEDYFPGKEGLALRSNYAWNEDMDIGTNHYGFSALAKGYHYSDIYGQIGTISAFWSTLETEDATFGKHYHAYFFNIAWNYAQVTSSQKIEGRCVRCLQDN